MEQLHTFQGKWITNTELCDLLPRNVYHRQLEKLELDCSLHRNRHVLFRRRFELKSLEGRAVLYITADDFYKLYINGHPVAMGPTPSYHFAYFYDRIDVTDYLREGENVIAAHTLYQGLINRVWQSGDQRHGLLLDLEVAGATVLCSDTAFLTAVHSGYREIGVVGYDTGFLEEYDCRAAEVGFALDDFDDSGWEAARIAAHADHVLAPSRTKQLVSERIAPVVRSQKGNTVTLDFGSNYVGYLCVTARGRDGDAVIVRQGQELCEDGSVRYALRANCVYEERWLLREGVSVLDQYDYKAFRYAELLLPEGCAVDEVYLLARHYPFTLTAKMKPEVERDPALRQIFALCVNTLQYGTQEAVLDCVDREKGYYIADGCYSALTHTILTGRDDMLRKLIDDAFLSCKIEPSMMNCLNSSCMQETTDAPLMLIKAIWWLYRYTGDAAYLRTVYPKAVALMEVYRKSYEREGLICELDKWCVVEWPKEYRDGYDVDLTQGKVCHEPHVVSNALYLQAIGMVNRMAAALSLPAYRDEEPVREAFLKAFYNAESGLFRDSAKTEHCSLIGNVFAFGCGLCPSEQSDAAVWRMIRERGISSVYIFGAFPILEGAVRSGRMGEISSLLLDEGAWLRMLREGATTTFEGWGKETKWNTSLFHLTVSYAAVFLADIDCRWLLL